MITHRFIRLTPGVLIDRLVNHGLYPVALEICSYLKISSNFGEVKVLRQWALQKVSYNLYHNQTLIMLLISTYISRVKLLL
jgi:hypothetical protein